MKLKMLGMQHGEKSLIGIFENNETKDVYKLNFKLTDEKNFALWGWKSGRPDDFYLIKTLGYVAESIINSETSRKEKNNIFLAHPEYNDY